jgi:hypothetical protein
LKLLRRLCLFASVLLLAGCAATVNKTTGQQPLQSSGSATSVVLVITGSPELQASADWHTFRAEWRSAFAEAARERGIQSAYLEAQPADQPGGTVLAVVKVNDYRYLTPGARFGFGIMTGNAYVDAEATFIEYPGAVVLGTRKFSTSSSAWQGIFSAMTNKQVRAISDEMLLEIVKK